MSASYHDGQIIIYEDGSVNPNLPFPDAHAVNAIKIKSKGLVDWILTYPDINYLSLKECTIRVADVEKIFRKAERLNTFKVDGGKFTEGKISSLWDRFLKMEKLTLINVMERKEVFRFLNRVMLGSSLKSLYIAPKDDDSFRMIDVAAILQYTDIEEVFLCGKLDTVDVEPIIHSLQNSKVKKLTVSVHEVSASAFHLFMHELHRTNVDELYIYDANENLSLPKMLIRTFEGPNWKRTISVWIDRVYIDSSAERYEIMSLIRPSTAIRKLGGLGHDGDAMSFLDDVMIQLHQIHGSELK